MRGLRARPARAGVAYPVHRITAVRVRRRDRRRPGGGARGRCWRRPLPRPRQPAVVAHPGRGPRSRRPASLPAHGTDRAIASGVLMVARRHRRCSSSSTSRPVAAAALVVIDACAGLGRLLHRAARAWPRCSSSSPPPARRHAFDGHWRCAGSSSLDTIAFGADRRRASRDSFAGVLAGTGIPLLVQRAIEHRDLVRERDRAQALLAEVAARPRGRGPGRGAARARPHRPRDARRARPQPGRAVGAAAGGAGGRGAGAGAGPAVLEPLDKAAALARDGLTEARAAVGALRDPVGLGLDDAARAGRAAPGRSPTLPSHGQPATSPPRPGTRSTARCRSR